MDFKFTPEDESFRQELRTFLETELPGTWEGGGRYPEEDDWDLTRVIRRRMADRGWLTMHWPEEYGGRARLRSNRPSLTRKSLPPRPRPRHLRRQNAGADSDDSRFRRAEAHTPASGGPRRGAMVPGIQRAGSGSDLASLSTRAVRDGDDLVINGGKSGRRWPIAPTGLCC